MNNNEINNNITFFIPAYNCAKTIEESVDSIMETNFKEGYELIIVNDCSVDNTSEVLENIKNKYYDKNIKIFTHKINKGGASARNTAVEYAENELLFCLDSDNILEKNSIEPLKNYLIKNNADAVAFGLHYFQKNINEITHKWVFENKEYTISDYFSKTEVPGASGNYLFTKQSWIKAGGYPEFSHALDAWGFGFRQVATGAKFLILSDSYYYHRWGIESYWVRESRKGKTSLIAAQIIMPFIDLLNENDIKYLFNKKSRHNWFENIEQRPLKLKNNESEFKKFLRRPLKYVFSEKK